MNSPSLEVCNKRVQDHLLGIYASIERVNIDDLILLPILRTYDLILDCVCSKNVLM